MRNPLLNSRMTRSSQPALLRLLVSAVVCVMILGPALQNYAIAASGHTQTWPAAKRGTPGFTGFTKKNGLRISVDTTWAGSRGYRPISFTIASAKPVLGDTQITVRFSVGPNWNTRKAMIVEHDLELLQGTSLATSTTLVPQYTNWQYSNWEVWVDGRLDEELTPNLNASMLGIQDTSYSALAFLTKDQQDYFREFLQHQEFDTHVISHGTQNHLLPEDWKYYTCFDLVLAYPEDLKRWSVTTPDRFAHLLRWVRGGGNLWVVETGAEYEKLDLIEQALSLENLLVVDATDNIQSKIQQQGWQLLPLDGTQTEGVDAVITLEGTSKTTLSDKKSPKDTEGNSLTADSRNHYLARSYGMGTVVAFSDSTNKSSYKIDAMLTAINRSLLGNRLLWQSRHGNDPGIGNVDFGKFLIPDVGTAPVIEFQLLISLFILAIGPLNYWLLKRRHQLPMMLLTVPVAALATTMILFAYGLVADGFSVRVRARSLTIIDQHQGESVSWARLSYYAGIAPANGLSMPLDTVVYPILPASSDSRSANQIREFHWDDEQKLTKGWLASRTPTQYLTQSARPTTKKISFQSTNKQLTAANKLGTKILTLVVRDQEGNFYSGSDIEADQVVTLKPGDSIQSMLTLRKLLTDNIPEFPPGLEMARPKRRSRNFNDYTYSLYEDSLLEDYLGAIISPMSTGLDHSVYIAITAEGPEVSLGLEDATESSSFHVVRGSWSYD